MYDRAPRSLTQAAAGTGQSVGPGTYEAPEIGRKKYGEFVQLCYKTSQFDTHQDKASISSILGSLLISLVKTFNVYVSKGS